MGGFVTLFHVESVYSDSKEEEQLHLCGVVPFQELVGSDHQHGSCCSDGQEGLQLSLMEGAEKLSKSARCCRERVH